MELFADVYTLHNQPWKHLENKIVCEDGSSRGDTYSWNEITKKSLDESWISRSEKILNSLDVTTKQFSMQSDLDPVQGHFHAWKGMGQFTQANKKLAEKNKDEEYLIIL